MEHSEKKEPEGFRSSPQQRHLWRLQQVDGLQPYRSACTVRVEGQLGPDTLQRALDQLVHRHEILRTTVRGLDGSLEPFQVINEYPSLWSAEIVNVAKDQHMVLLTASAIVLDAQSLRNLAKELSELLSTGPVSQDALQFADLAEWQNNLLEFDEAAAGIDYWRTRPTRAPSGLRLPMERPPKETTFKPSVVSAAIASELLSDVLSQLSTTLHTFLLACWQVYCWRLSRTTAIGVLNDGRTQEELQAALGPFEKYLPTCSELQPELSFRSFLDQLTNTVAEANEWQECFSPELIQPVSADEETFWLPLCFSFSLAPASWTASLSFSIVDEYCCSDRFKLKLSCVAHSDRVALDFHYDTAVFAKDDIQTMAEQFQTLVASIVRNHECSLGRLELVSDAERQRLVFDFNNTSIDYPSFKGFSRLWREAVRQSPNNIAVVLGEHRLTYAELDAKSNQVANALRSFRVTEDTVVPICVERSLEMVIAVLGVLRTGAAFAPLNPSWPVERLNLLLDDLDCELLLTQERLAARFSERRETVLKLESDFDCHSVDSLEEVADADSLAYVIYTSGSTGLPKGVMVSRRGFLNYLRWSIDFYQVAKGFGSIVNSDFSFDLTITSLFLPLLTGRTVVLLREGGELEGLVQTLASETEFSLLKITPAHLEVLHRQIEDHVGRFNLRTIVVGGENLLAETLSFWRGRQLRIVNEYGPTETVVGCCVHEVSPGSPTAGSIPIGRPIANMEIYLLDEYLQVVGMGMVGELYIGGAGVARGYLKRADLTAERFVPDPFSGRAGARLYRSGDLGRYLANGEVEFLGRIDQQVKVRGYRVELGEIETVLGTHPEVREAAVLLRDEKLIGYVGSGRKGEGKKGPSSRELREYLKGRLPEFMVPSQIVVLEQLPISPNGKLDKRALPAAEQRPEERQYVAPRNKLEQELVKIWEEVLGMKGVGVEDNFFELGGHSLLATQVISRLRRTCGLELPLQRMFEHPTIAALAVSIIQTQLEQMDPAEAVGLIEEIQSARAAELALVAEEQPVASGVGQTQD